MRILNYRSKESIFDNEIYKRTSFIVFAYPFHAAQLFNPYHAEYLFVLCVCREGGYFYLVFCNANLSHSELNTKSFSCQTNRIRKNIFIDNIYNAINFQVAC